MTKKGHKGHAKPESKFWESVDEGFHEVSKDVLQPVGGAIRDYASGLKGTVDLAIKESGKTTRALGQDAADASEGFGFAAIAAAGVAALFLLRK